MLSYEAVSEQAELLCEEDRERLARELIAGLPPSGEDVSPAHWEAAWGAEIESRLHAYERGEVASLPWSESMRQLREVLASGGDVNP